MRWYQDDKGNASTMRIIVVAAAMAGILLVGAGAVAMYIEKPAAGVAMTTGAGIIAGALGAKALQKRSENGAAG